MSKTQEALAWLDNNPSKSQSEAAREFEIKPATVSRAWNYRERMKAANALCPTCGQKIRKIHG